MKNNKSKILMVLGAAVLLMTACGGGNNSSSTESSQIESQTSSEVTSSSVTSSSQYIDDESYVIKVTAPTGVTYTIDKESAKKGETVTLTITSVGQGYVVRNVEVNGSEVAPSGDNVYTFVMPNRSVNVVINVSVSGDVVIEGDINVKLDKEGDVYVARNVKVDVDKDYANFSFVVGGTKLGCLDLDESQSFGDIQICYDKNNSLSVANGNSYDFYYDTTDMECPCRIIRTSVDYLPTSEKALSSLLMTTNSVRSEHALYTGNLIGAEYTKTDKTTNDIVTQKYTWKKYANNTALATVVDTLDETAEPMYVYRSFDEANNLYTVVDTYAKYVGSVLANDDPYRESYNKNQAYAARYEVIDGDDYGYRYAKSTRNVNREVNTISHMPGYFLERDIMYSYRVGFTADEMTANEILITSEETDTGFDVNINSFIEYDCNGGTYTSVIHEAYKFAVSMSFLPNGALTSLTYGKTLFTKEQWNFKTHEPATGTKGTKVVSISASYTYGDDSNEICTFDTTPYFISSIEELQFYNPKTEADKSTGKSYVNLDDSIALSTIESDRPSNLIALSYSPSTALDLWQYSPTSSTNTEVIAHLATDTYNQMTAINVGTSDVTFTNNLTGAGAGASKTISIEVIALQRIWNFYLFEDNNPYSSITDATPVQVKAGTIHRYLVKVHRSDAPRIYEAVSSNPEYAKVTSAPDAEYLVIDFSGSLKITKTEKVSITMTSTHYDYKSNSTLMDPTVFTFVIIPTDIDPTGVWGLADLEDHVQITFSSDSYPGDETMKLGTIEDDGYDPTSGTTGTSLSATFAYVFENGELKATLKTISFTKNTEGWSTNASDYMLYFEYHPELNQYGVCLAEAVYDSDYGDYIYSPIYGDVDEYGDVTGLYGFNKIR